MDEVEAQLIIHRLRRLRRLGRSEETQVTTATSAQRLNDVSGRHIVYTDLTSPGRRVTLYDVIPGATSVVGSGTLDQNPRIDGDIVVFERGLGSAADLYAVNFATTTRDILL